MNKYFQKIKAIAKKYINYIKANNIKKKILENSIVSEGIADLEENSIDTDVITIVLKDASVVDKLYEDKTLYVHETNNPKKGELAITHYQVLQKKNKYSLIKIRIETGKKNQIRVHLNGLGHPIIGDKKYGSTKNPIGRLGLHATYLELEITKGNTLKIECPAPKEFYQILEIGKILLKGE